MFGLGRYLYNLPSGWVEFDPASKKFTDKAKVKLTGMLVQHYRRATEGKGDEEIQLAPPRQVDTDTGEIIAQAHRRPQAVGYRPEKVTGGPGLRQKIGAGKRNHRVRGEFEIEDRAQRDGGPGRLTPGQQSSDPSRSGALTASGSRRGFVTPTQIESLELVFSPSLYI